MRFSEFKVVLKEAADNVVVIGDSIAVGIGGSAPYAQGGISAQEVLNRVNQFVKSGQAKGATVILSTGASNSAPVELENGNKIPSKLGSYPEQQIKALVNAGAKVAVVGVASEKSGWFPATKFTNGSKYRVDLTGINGQLETAAEASGAKFLGPLEQYDPSMHNGKGDGLHPFGGYKKLYQAGSTGATSSNKTVAPPASISSGQGSQPVTTSNGKLFMGPPFEPEDYNDVKTLQKGLEALGYSVGRTGIDGKYGPRTAVAVTAFKKDYKLSGDGSSMDSTATQTLNNVLAGKIPKVERPSQVEKVKFELAPLATDAVTTGKVGAVLNLIARVESGGRYNIILGGRTAPLTDMTLEQVFALQDQMRRAGKESSAVGRYQYIQSSLKDVVGAMGLDPKTTKFDERTQDNIAITDMRRRAGLDSWLANKIGDDRFLENLSKIWAGLPSPSKAGSSFYAGTGSNRANVDLKTALNSLQNISAGVAVA